MYISATELRVRYAETDQMGVVYYGQYATYLEVGRVESIRSLGYTYKQMEEEGVLMPVVRMEIDFLRSARYDDLLTVESTVLPFDPGLSAIRFHQRICNEQGKVLTSAFVDLVFVSAATFRKVLMPEKLCSLLQPFYPDPID